MNGDVPRFSSLKYILRDVFVLQEYVLIPVHSTILTATKLSSILYISSIS